MADNVRVALNAFEALFNKRDYAAAERFWSPNYIQHSAHIAPSWEGLFELVKTLRDTLRYDNHVEAASGDYVILHGLGIGGSLLGCPVRREDGFQDCRDRQTHG